MAANQSITILFNSTATIHLPPSPPMHRAIFLFNMIGMIGLGSLGILGSAVVTALIFAHKSLRSPCFELIAIGSIGSCLVAIYHVSIGIYSICGSSRLISMSMPRWRCALLNLSGLWGIPFHSIMICFVGFDRLHSLVAPVRHLTFGRPYVIGISLGCALFVTTKITIGLSTSDQSQSLPICMLLDDLVSKSFMEYYGGLNIFYYSVSVALYLAIMVNCYWRSASIRNRQISSTRCDLFAQRQALVIPSVRLMIILYFICGLGGEILINSVRQLEQNQTTQLVRAFGVNLKVICSLVEIFSLLLKSSKFRLCFRQSFGFMPKNVVEPISRIALTNQGRSRYGR